MSYVLFIVIAAISWLVGVFGWAQIIGGFQHLKTRGGVIVITILLWTVIIAATFFVVFKFFQADIWAWVIGMAVSFVQVLRTGKIE